MKRVLLFVLLSFLVFPVVGIAEDWEGLKQYDSLAEYEEATGKKIEQFHQAPMFDALVSEGKLPPVEERLPENPQIVNPVEEIGQYGGTVNVFTPRTNRTGEGAYLSGIDPLFRIGTDLSSIVPNIAVKWEFSDGGKTLTVHLREGIKWSDGVPFTADDILFWYEDVLLNENLTPTISSNWRPGGETMKVEKIDDYTLAFSFVVPYPTIELLLAHSPGSTVYLPKHYLQQFHVSYNPKADELAKEKGFDAWYMYFQERNRMGFIQVPLNPDLPTIKPFKCIEWTSTHSLIERNPYYWKVDTAGNQLPYIDKVFCTKVEDREMLDAKVVSGEYDFFAKGTNLMNYTMYKENAEKGNYRVLMWASLYGANIIYQPNQTVKDPVLREIFRDARFRQALSLAINREEINEMLYYGLGVPRQFTLIPESKYFEEEFAEAYAEYDVEEANRLLDEMGLKWDANHEFRLRPDGKKLAWTLEYITLTGAVGLDRVNELVKEYWKELGCDLTLKLLTAEFYTQRVTANEVEMNFWTGDKVGDILWFFDNSREIFRFCGKLKFALLISGLLTP